MVTIQITATNPVGDQRIFEATAVAKHGDRVYMFSSWPANNPTIAMDIHAITKTFQEKDAIKTAGPKAPPSPSATPASKLVSIPDNWDPMAPQKSKQGRNSNVASSIPPGQPTPPRPAPTPPPLTSPKSNPSPDATKQEASPINSTPAEISEQAAQFVQTHHNSLIIVEGNKGVGSGFLCNLGGKTFAITNAHVLSDNNEIKFKALNGTALVPSNGAIAVDHDIVRLEIQSTAKTLEVMIGIDEKVKIGDAVVIPGNSEGAGVVKPVEGKVVGIGPNLIEVDAPFVRGNSGSPIIHRDTGKAIAVATYLIERKVSSDDKGSVKMETRRFGYRLDSVSQWEPLNWQRFNLQSSQVAKMESISSDFIKMFESAHEKKGLDPSDFTTPDIRKAIQDYRSALSIKTNKYGASTVGASSSDIKDALRRLFSDLRSISHRDTSAFDSRNAYDYFRRQVSEEQHLRDQVYDIFTQLMESNNQ